jgi:hypothetical protein
MSIVLTCDAPGCTASAVVPLLNLDGRLPMPAGWWVQSSREHTVVACSTAHFGAVLAGQQPPRAAAPAP